MRRNDFSSFCLVSDRFVDNVRMHALEIRNVRFALWSIALIDHCCVFCAMCLRRRSLHTTAAAVTPYVSKTSMSVNLRAVANDTEPSGNGNMTEFFTNFFLIHEKFIITYIHHFLNAFEIVYIFPVPMDWLYVFSFLWWNDPANSLQFHIQASSLQPPLNLLAILPSPNNPT